MRRFACLCFLEKEDESCEDNVCMCFWPFFLMFVWLSSVPIIGREFGKRSFGKPVGPCLRNKVEDGGDGSEEEFLECHDELKDSTASCFHSVHL